MDGDYMMTKDLAALLACELLHKEAYFTSQDPDVVSERSQYWRTNSLREFHGVHNTLANAITTTIEYERK